MNIITKFTLSSQPGIDALLMLTKALATEKFATLVDKKTLARYIDQHFSTAVLMAETNSMSNQWLVVYVDNNPAGYARITAKGTRPAVLAGKRAMRIADFGVLQQYPDAAIRDSLFEKCRVVCQPFENIWINEYLGNPFIDFFESKGFTRQPAVFQLDDLSLPSVCLIK